MIASKWSIRVYVWGQTFDVYNSNSLVSPLSFFRPRYNWLKNTMGDNYTAGLLIRAVAGKMIQ
jgi:hypothetical protein